MQPPPRKGNYTKFLKNLHTEQINKLLLKNQHECDLLEDIRTFTLKRSAIEKSYSEALLKISSSYLNKKIPNIPDIKVDGGEEKWNMWNVWRTVLEENEKIARARLAAVEVFHQQISDDAKILRAYKIHTAKRCVDQLATVHKELQSCVQELDKTKKLYFEEEHIARDVRDKARDIEEKLKKKKGSFFTSISSLQKNSAKVSSRRDQLEEKSTGARNDYIFSLAAANAHQTRYFVVDLQLCMTTMESGVYDKVAEYLSLMGRTELLTCSAVHNSFTVVRDQGRQLTREYNLQCCYLYYPVLKQHIQYELEPCDGDPINVICIADQDATAAAELTKEARRWAARISRETNTVKENLRQLQALNALRDAGQRVDPADPNGLDLDTKIEDVRHTIRRAETAKCKAEARIECLRAGGINVDEYLLEAEALNVQDIQRSTSSLSDHPSSESFYDSDFADAEAPAPSASRPDSAESKEKIDDFDVDAMVEADRHRMEAVTGAWEDPTQVEWGVSELPADVADTTTAFAQETISASCLLKCTALYSYKAQNPDELNIIENEQLEVVGDGDGDGWVRARNYKGEEGYVPQNYLDIEQQTTAAPGMEQTGQISFSSVDYTVTKDDTTTDIDATTISESITGFTTEHQSEPETPYPIQMEEPASSSPTYQLPPVAYCCAVYDYDGEGDEELTFDEGQIIRIVSKIAHSIDDGWWRGELDGKIGNFPSLVVEECNEFGEPLLEQDGDTPPPSAPPVFTPPDAPTPTTPIDDDDYFERVQSDTSERISAADMNAFSMALSRNQHQQYSEQFAGDVTSTEPLTEIPTKPTIIKPKEVVARKKSSSDASSMLDVAQIVITAATPMTEEAERAFPCDEATEAATRKATTEGYNVEDDEDIDEGVVVIAIEEPIEGEDEEEDLEEEEGIGSNDDRDATEESDAIAEDTPPSAGSGTGSEEGESTTEASTTDNTTVIAATQRHATSANGNAATTTAPPQPVAENNANSVDARQLVAGRASIPEVLEPHQLASLQDLKESNA